MDSDAHTDSFASLFRPTHKPRFADLDWPVWDGDVFDPDMQALNNGHELAFIAGTTYVRRAVSVERPRNLRELLDKATLNHLGRFGVTGFVIGEERALERMEEDRDLLASFRSGTLLAIDELRNAKVPDDANKDDLKEFIDALESFVHVHFVAMAELGPGVAEAVRAENVLTGLTAMRIAEDSEGHEIEEHSEDELTTEGRLQDEPNAKKAIAQKDEESQDDNNAASKDNDDSDGYEDEGEGSEYFGESRSRGGITSSSHDDEEGEDEDEDGMKSSSFSGNEIAQKADTTLESDLNSTKRAKRAKSKKAKKAKVQAKRDKKKVDVVEAKT